MSARVRRQSYRSQTRAEVRFGMLIPRRTDDGKGDPVSDGHEDGAKPPGYRLMLREMAADERPREKLKLRGSAALVSASTAADARIAPFTIDPRAWRALRRRWRGRDGASVALA